MGILFVQSKETWDHLFSKLYHSHTLRRTSHFIANFVVRSKLQYMTQYISTPTPELHCWIPFSFALDGWAFKNNAVIKNHRSLEDRKTAAQFLQQKNPLCPVVLDTMENLSSSKYAALPERLYVLQAGNVIYKVKTTNSNKHNILRSSTVKIRMSYILFSSQYFTLFHS